MVNVTKPILCSSCLCEQGPETHLAKTSFLRFGDGHAPLISKGGVYFVNAQTVNAVENTTRDKSQERCVQAERSDSLSEINADEMTDRQNHVYKLTDCKIRVYELTDCRIHAYELTDCRVHAYELMNGQAIHAYELTDGQKSHGYELRDGQATHAYELTDGQKSHGYELTVRADGLKNSCVRADGTS